MTTSIDYFRRVEVKASLEHGGWLWLGTADGLFRCRLDGDEPADPIEEWRGSEIQALAADGDGVVVCAYDGSAATLARCDGAGRRLSEIALPPNQKVKAIAVYGQYTWLGTKQGVFRTGSGNWQHVFDGNGKAEIIKLWHDGETLGASVKKMAPNDMPALIESRDAGETWQIEIQPDYQDNVIAANGSTIITKWRGARRRGRKAGYKKHPITAGLIDSSGRTAVVDGDKLEIEADGAAKLATYHPAFGDAEHVHLTPRGVVVAGAQGAWRFEPASGRLADLLPATSGSRPYGKIKRVFQLDQALITTTTFGAFRSLDGGASWDQCDSEWRVLDAEHARRDGSGRWWIACQRGLFRTDDQGVRIDYHKIKVQSDHYGELRALAIAGDRLCVGTKQGLFVNRPASDAEQFARIDVFGRTSIEGLAWDERRGCLYVGTAAGRLWAWDLVTTPTLMAELPIHEATMIAGDGRLWLASKDRITEITGKDRRDITPNGLQRSAHLADLGDSLLAWDAQCAWTRPKRGADWQSCSGWPEGIRHVAVDALSRRVIATDRARLHALAL